MDWTKISKCHYKNGIYEIKSSNGILVSKPLELHDKDALGNEAFYEGMVLEISICRWPAGVDKETWASWRNGAYFTPNGELRVVVIHEMPTGFEIHGLHRIPSLTIKEIAYLHAMISMQIISTSVSVFTKD